MNIYIVPHSLLSGLITIQGAHYLGEGAKRCKYAATVKDVQCENGPLEKCLFLSWGKLHKRSIT